MIAVVLPISRTDYLKEVFKCLSELEKPDDTELLIIIDGNKRLEKAIGKKLGSLNFKTIKIINHTDKPASTINARRQRISDIHNLAKHNISKEAEYVFLIEDDTTYPSNTLKRFLGTIDKDTGYIEGVELGRYNAHYVGAWKVNNLSDPNKVTSAIPIKGNNHLEPIDAGGLYCCLVKSDLYRNHHFEPYDKVGENGLSCDVNFGLYIRRKGYKCYLDWSVKCGHLTEGSEITIDNTEPHLVEFSKLNDEWKCRFV